MIVVGFLVGPTLLNWISTEILSISSILRQIALVVVLTRSGLNLDIRALRKAGRAAIMMCFVPATFEIAGACLASHWLLGLDWFEGLLLGSVLGAVSPAVVSPRMIRLIEDGYTGKSIPQIILGGASADDTYTIVLFYAFLGILRGGSFDAVSVALIPATIVSVIAMGLLAGIGLVFLYRKTRFPLPVNVLIFFALSMLMLGIEELLKPYLDVSSLLAVVVMGMCVLFKLPKRGRNYRTAITESGSFSRSCSSFSSGRRWPFPIFLRAAGMGCSSLSSAFFSARSAFCFASSEQR